MPLSLRSLGKSIRAIRENRGWSQEELAIRSHLHRTYIGAVERGERNISFKNLVAIANALRTPLQEIVKASDR